VDELRGLLDADSVGLTVLDRTTGRYIVRSVAGDDPEFIGVAMEPGQGLAGRAIRDRALVVDGTYDPTRHDAAMAAGVASEPMAGVAVPLIRDDVVVGAVTIVRHDLERPFAPDELEALPIVAGLVALAITNTFLHADVTELSVRDPLTGLFNRRHLDATLARLEALRTRRAIDARERVAIVIFDLDQFGEINKLHGHQVGDAILRAFAEVLRTRFRGSDLVARYGGEEFLAILDDAGVEDARNVAEEIRSTFAQVIVSSADGSPISATVSAGCAGMGADRDRFADVVARADVGLVLAKRSGRDRVIAA
jgi:two-component system cell cycle response regulator